MYLAEVKFANRDYGIRSFEVDVNDEGKIRRVDLTLNELEKQGVKVNLNGFRVVERWLNGTEEGQRYLDFKFGKRMSVAAKPVTRFGKGKTGGAA